MSSLSLGWEPSEPSVVVECPAVRVAPGRMVQRAPAELLVPATVAGQHFAQLFAGTDIRVTVTPDFVTAAWWKLCLNVAGGAITALTDRPLGVMRRADVAQVARHLIAECLAVGRAEGNWRYAPGTFSSLINRLFWEGQR